MPETLLHADVTEKIIKAFFHVYNTLGYGFLEKVYQNALLITLRKLGFDVAYCVPIKVFFEGELVGEYFADLVINGVVIIELKAVEALVEAHETQLINYLRATPIEVGLLVNFGPKAVFRRKVFANDRKPGIRKE
ncbi:MAG TPA: GxxExxY protein [Gemmataceae bacterium]|jgi:GxxExxY protein|nr:GxxExxY protein [Gemmataceae bacterium]